MITRFSKSLICKNLIKSNSILARNCHHQNSVALAFNEYQKQEPKASPLIVLHGLFGSKSNW